MRLAEAELFKALDAALSAKRTREATFARLNQLLQKQFPALPETYLTQDNCEVRSERLTAEQLKHFHPGHGRTDPHQMTGPIVAWEYSGETYLLDGTNRLNVWLRDGDNAAHETIVVWRRDAKDA
jgi:hypothetical protein